LALRVTHAICPRASVGLSNRGLKQQTGIFI
jgi:hypothetical protein